MFEKTLGDLIRGIRGHVDDEAGTSSQSKFISSCMDEIRKELAQPDLDIKANALAKLTYLQMLGYDMSWAAFHVVEVMTSKKFAHKRIGFLAASQSFHDSTDVLMLTTNMLKKSLTSHNQYESALALNGLSNFIREDLARDLASDLISLLTSVRPYVRKRATLVMYKLFLKYPEALRAAFPRLKDKLEDDDPGVQAAAVHVICELARKNPKNYLSLAPTFFKLLTTSNNNWLRIKIVKLFAALCPLEPRLGRKLIEPLTELIHGTPATSLLYECINTVLAGIPDHTATIQLCVQKLRIFIEDSDQNLKYLGLQAMSSVLKIAPKAVMPHRDLIIACLDDDDESIRLRALDLLAGMVNKKTLIDIVRKLLQHLETTEGQTYRDEVVAKIIAMCSQSTYQYVTNFEWYVQVLVQLTRVENTRHGDLIRDQLMDVAIRVKVLRPFACKQMAALLMDQRLCSAHNVECGISEVLYAAAWVAGEFSDHLDEDAATAVIEALLQPRAAQLPGHIQAVFIHNALKVYATMAQRLPEESEAEAAAAAESGRRGAEKKNKAEEDTAEAEAAAAAEDEGEAAQGAGEADASTTPAAAAAATGDADGDDDGTEGGEDGGDDTRTPSATTTTTTAAAAAALSSSSSATRIPPASRDNEVLRGVRRVLTTRLPLFVQSGDLEVQERAVVMAQVVAFVESDLGKGHHPHRDIAALFAGNLNPVAPKAQRKVPIPENVDLDRWINTPPESEDEEEDKNLFSDTMFAAVSDKTTPMASRYESDDEEELQRKRQIRMAAQASNPYHLGQAASSSSPGPTTSSTLLMSQEEVDKIPMQTLDLGPSIKLDVAPPLGAGGALFGEGADTGAKAKKKRRKKRKKLSKKEKKRLKKKGLPVPASGDDDDDDEAEAEAAAAAARIDVLAQEDMPEGAEVSDDEKQRAADDPHAALDIDLDTADASFQLPQPSHYDAMAQHQQQHEEGQGKAERKKKKKKDKKKRKKKSSKGKAAEAQETPVPIVDVSGGIEEPHEEEKQQQSNEMSALDSWLSEEKPTKKKKESDKTEKGKKSKKDNKKKKKEKKKAKEEAAKDQGAATSTPPPASPSLRPLLKDATIAVAYDVTPVAGGIQVGFVVKNHSATAPVADVTLAAAGDSQLKPSDAIPLLASSIAADATATATVALNTDHGPRPSSFHATLKYRMERPTAELDPAAAAKAEEGDGGDGGEEKDEKVEKGEDEEKEEDGEGVKEEGQKKEEEGEEDKSEEGADAAAAETTAEAETKGNGDNVVTHDVVIEFPITDFLFQKPCAQEEFRSLLEDGDLSPLSSVTLNKQGVAFDAAVSTVANIVHGTIVEASPDVASVYAATVADGHVCLRINDQEESVTVEAKCSSEDLTTSVLDHLKSQLS